MKCAVPPARHRVPAIYYDRFFVRSGGLISYGPDLTDQFRRAAIYVDRVLKGEKPADLPVQAPVKFETVRQSQDRQGARAHGATNTARPRRRGDRVSWCDVRYWHKADVARLPINVRFQPDAAVENWMKAWSMCHLSLPPQAM